ncbi:MAG: hypothetical protein ICV62_00415 [Cyanobacteria bacterium Co-bin13]|nr:hypothetical protein [Cyanobacteria bacterium Co-bin13]
MTDQPISRPTAQASTATLSQKTADLSDLELVQALAERLAIKPQDWHRLNRNRKVRAGEQIASALVYLLKDQPEEALVRLQQATGWLDRSLQAPPCPSHGHRQSP